MANQYKLIDMTTWKRQPYCQIFRQAVQPQYSVSFELDITQFKNSVKNRHESFTLAFIYAVSKCANEIEEFRYRFLNGDVVLYESVDTSFTYLDKETELFKVINAPMKDTAEEFIRTAAAIAENQRQPFTGPVPDDVFQFSALPWIAFTHVSHTDFGNREKAQPLFDWGKFYEKDGRWKMPFSVQVHHSFVDGIHVGKLADKLQRYLEET